MDAAGNSLLRYGPGGRVSTLAVFPTVDTPNPFPGEPATIATEAVPTEVVRGPDGAWYVSLLTGFPFPVGGSSIVRVPFLGGEPEAYRDGPAWPAGRTSLKSRCRPAEMDGVLRGVRR